MLEDIINSWRSRQQNFYVKILKLDQVYCAWLSKGLLCLYVEKVEIWSGVTDPSHTHTDKRISRNEYRSKRLWERTEDEKWEIEQYSRRTDTANGIKTVWNRQGEIMMTLMTIIMTATMIVFQKLKNKGGEIMTATIVYDYTRCFKYLCLAWNTTSVPDEEGSSTHACYDHWDCVEGMVSFCLCKGFQVSTWFSFQDVSEARGRRDRQGVLHRRACRPSRLCWQQRLLGRVSIA